MKRAAALLLFAVLAAAAARAESVHELFRKVKADVHAGNWQGGLATLDALEAEAAQPGNESVRQQLEGPVAFYRGVCQANLGQAEAARASFEAFLAVQPTASLDPSMYSKKAIAAFEAARRGTGSAEASGGAVSAPGKSPSLFRAYQEFKPPPNISEPPSASWADGPVRWLMTHAEKQAWSQLVGDGERAEFVDKFWASRNPDPGNPDNNTFRTGFERRAAFADAYFVQDETKRGSLTDRGMVFVLLGPPTWGGRKPIKAGEDADEQNGMRVYDPYTGAFIGMAPESNMNYQEVWHYRRELLPKGVGYQQVDIVFITRKGYGKNVLQRNPDTLTTLDAARRKPE